jgi:iron complex transport system substrate-binding protein
VWISNHRSVAGILDYIRRLGALVGAAEKSAALAQDAEQHIAQVQNAASRLPRRPRVYFEEWDDPMISGILWVAELVRIAGGDDIFPERAEKSLARDRIIADPAEVIRRAPDIVFGSWCGKKFRPAHAARAGWDVILAVRDGELHEIKSPIILQPGPAALFDGLMRCTGSSRHGRLPTEALTPLPVPPQGPRFILHGLKKAGVFRQASNSFV